MKKALLDDLGALRRGFWILVLGICASSCLSDGSGVELTVQSDDVTLHVEVSGRKEAENVLVAIHGGPGNSSDYMVSLKQLAGARLCVVLYDQRGTGRSSAPKSGYALHRYIEDLEGIRKFIGVERMHVFGHSWGGIVAMRYATLHPQNVRSLILMGSGPPNSQASASAQAYGADRIAALQQRGIIPERIATIHDLLPAYFSDPGFEMPEELAKMSYSPAAERQTMMELGEYDFADDVAKITHPVLILWGEDDLFGRPMMEATVEALQNADVKTEILRKCGHFWHECPDEFFSQIEAFLADH